MPDLREDIARLKSDVAWLKWAIGGLYVVALSGVRFFDPTLFHWPF